MMYIKDGAAPNWGIGLRAATWHIGEPLVPAVSFGRVMTFQADEDELELILKAMQATYFKRADPVS